MEGPPDVAAAGDEDGGEVAHVEEPASGSPGTPTRSEDTKVLYRVSNELNREVVIEARDGSRLILSPLETRPEIDQADIARFALRCWFGEIRVEKMDGQKPASALGVWVAIGIGFWFAIAWAMTAAFVGTPTWWIVGWVALIVAILIAGLIDVFRISASHHGQSVPAALGGWFKGKGGQLFYLTLGILIGLALPTITIFFAADAWGLIDDVRNDGVSSAHAAVLTLIGRVMQVIFVAIASLTPALLFFLFDREHLETLRNRFTRQMMRFDPAVRTRQDVLVKYGDGMDEAYGRDRPARSCPAADHRCCSRRSICPRLDIHAPARRRADHQRL